MSEMLAQSCQDVFLCGESCGNHEKERDDLILLKHVC